MTDDEFLRCFMDCTLPNDRFHHRDHLRLVWLLTRRLGAEQAAIETAAGIRRFAAAQGHTQKYHETMTQFWLRLVAHLIRQRPEIQDFERFIAAYPQLMDKHLPLRHWRSDTMFGQTARATWVEPDLLPLPV